MDLRTVGLKVDDIDQSNGHDKEKVAKTDQEKGPSRPDFSLSQSFFHVTVMDTFMIDKKIMDWMASKQ